MDELLNLFSRLTGPPARGEDFAKWLRMDDVPAFLSLNARSENFIVYGVASHAFLHAVLIPAELANPPDVPDLLNWEGNPYASWGVSVHYSEPVSVRLSPPLEGAGSKTLEQGEQLVFERTFEGRSRESRYYEFLQKFVHVLGAHFLEERNAYCILDKHGDIADVIRIVESPKDDALGTVIVVDRVALDEYLLLTDAVVALTFDFPRYDPGSFCGWKRYDKYSIVEDEDLFYRLHQEDAASCIRGCQIVRPRIQKDSLFKRYRPEKKEEDRYESFIIHDWKNRAVCEVSCAPGNTCNYFTKSDLPFELSPAFFRAEVLSKYKADSEKYVLGERSISCRGGWYLKGMDINEAGQVHAYLVDLRSLPFEEQQHWRSYNEKPKGEISSRAFKADMMGCWCEEYNPLESLKNCVHELEIKHTPWWQPRPDSLVSRINYTVTTSADEWANDLMLLDQFIVEGFSKSWLKNRATEMQRPIESTFGSLRLLDECLSALNFSPEDIKATTDPLKTLHLLRTKLRGHSVGADTTTEIKRNILMLHRTYREHYRTVCQDCAQSLHTIAEALAVWETEG